LSQTDKNNTDKQKSDTKSGSDLPGSPSGYSFFVNEPGNAAYTFGVDATPPDWFKTMTAGLPVTQASAPVASAAPIVPAADLKPRAPVGINPVPVAVPIKAERPAAAPISVTTSSNPSGSLIAPGFFDSKPVFDYNTPVYTAEAAARSLSQSSGQANVVQDVFLSQGVTISQDATHGKEATITQSARPTEEAKVFENAFDWQHTSVAQNASYSPLATVAQDAFSSTVQHSSVAQNASYSQQANVAQNASYSQQAIVAQNAFTSQQASVVQNAFSREDASVSQDAFATPNYIARAAESSLAQSQPQASNKSATPVLRNWNVQEPAVKDDGGSSGQIWPKPRPKVNKGAVTTAPLHLALDKRFASLLLTAELSATVDRIYSLVDLDFNGYVDFFEMSSVLDGDHLSESEKGFVRLIYAVGCKILAERPTLADGTVPAMTKQDFALAFAFQCASTLGNTAAANKGILASGDQPQTFSESKPTLYADIDYPLVSIKSSAVKLGTTGDAYFAAGISALAESRPRAVMRMICENIDHSFTINFPGVNGKPLEVMPPRPEELMRYNVAAKYGFWFPLLEKAYGINLAQTHRLATKLSDHRNESFARASEVIESITAASTGTLVTADCAPDDLLRQVANLVGKKHLLIAVSSDFVPEASTFTGMAPIANKPYPLIALDVQRSQLYLASVYGEQSALGEEPMHFNTEQFLRYFKVIYFEEDSDTKVSHLMRSTQKPSSGGNPWKKG